MLLHQIAALTFNLSLALLGTEVPLSPGVETLPEAYLQTPMSVVPDGGDFLALWLTQQSYAAPLSFRLARIGADGKLVAGAGTVIPSSERFAQLATNGATFLLAYGNRSAVYTQRVSGDGALIGEPQLVASNLRPSYFPALVANGSSFLLLVPSQLTDQTSAFLLDDRGAVVRELPPLHYNIVVAGEQNGEFVIIDGIPGQYALHRFTPFGARTDIPLGLAPQSTIRFAAASPDRIFIGEYERPDFRRKVLDANGRVLFQADGGFCSADNSESHAAAWDGSEFVAVCLSAENRLFATRYATDGTRIGDVETLSTTADTLPLFATNGGAQLVVWGDRRFGANDLVARAGIAPGAEPQLVSYSGRPQRAVQLARAGDHRLAVWRDAGDRLETVLDGATLSLDSTAGRPAVIAGQRSFLTAWTPEGRLAARRIGFSGELLDREPIALDGESFSDAVPGLAYRAPLFVVAQDNVARAVTDDGQLLNEIAIPAPPDALSHAVVKPLWAGSELRFATASLGGGQHRSPGVFPYYFTFSVASSPAIFRTSEFYSTAPNAAAIAAGPDRLTFAWIDGTSALRVEVAQSSLDGTQRLAGPVAIPDETQAAEVEVVWNGSEYVVAWSGRVEGELARRIRAMRFDRNGQSLDASPIAISPQGATSDRPSLAVTASGVDIAYSRVDEQYGGAPRAYVRPLERLLPYSLRRPAVRH